MTKRKKATPPAELKTVSLEDLTGPHVLSGVDFDKTEVSRWDGFEIAQCMRFMLDGVCYLAVEDPNDGYRSTLDKIVVVNDKCQKTFKPTKVIGEMKPKGEDGHNDHTLQLVNAKNGALVLELGTDNSYDYYPWYVASFFEENLYPTSI